jgi:hypothetical protein
MTHSHYEVIATVARRAQADLREYQERLAEIRNLLQPIQELLDDENTASSVGVLSDAREAMTEIRKLLQAADRADDQEEVSS